jgi:hypothetical protein
MESNLVESAMVNLDQFRISTRTILAEEHFRIGFICLPSRKTNRMKFSSSVILKSL